MNSAQSRLGTRFPSTPRPSGGRLPALRRYLAAQLPLRPSARQGRHGSSSHFFGTEKGSNSVESFFCVVLNRFPCHIFAQNSCKKYQTIDGFVWKSGTTQSSGWRWFSLFEWLLEYTLFWDQPICNLIFHQQKLFNFTEKNAIHIRLKIIILWA
jgi:hypothetical protein